MNETASDVGAHPAVLGFTIFNELDSSESSYPFDNTTQDFKPSSNATDYFASQTIQLANLVKSAAPDKLVGWAIRDIPGWPSFAFNHTPHNANASGLNATESYFEQIAAAFDFFGVNSYQSSSLATVLGHHVDVRWRAREWSRDEEPAKNGFAYGASQLAPYIKPVILTEFGFATSGNPSTYVSKWCAGHVGAHGQCELGPSAGPTPLNASDLYSSEETLKNAIKAMETILQEAFGMPPVGYASLCLGVFYFEFADEWWALGQPHEHDPDDGKIDRVRCWHEGKADELCCPCGCNATFGDIATFDFPNRCADQESYGLFSRARAGGRSNSSNNFPHNGPQLPVDALTPKSDLVGKLRGLYTAAPGRRLGLPPVTARSRPAEAWYR